MIDDEPAWMSQGFDDRKPAARMKAVFAAIDEGAPAEIVESVYWPAARHRFRDIAKVIRDLDREVAKRGRADVAVVACNAAWPEDAQAALLSTMRQIFSETGDAELGRSVARTISQVDPASDEPGEVWRRVTELHPEHDDARRDLAWFTLRDDPDAAVGVLDALTEHVPFDLELRRQAAVRKGDAREARELFDDIQHAMGGDPTGTAMDLAQFNGSQGRFAAAAEVLKDTVIPWRRPPMAAAWIGMMARHGHGADAARQVRERFGSKVPGPLGADVFHSLQAYDEELATSAAEAVFGFPGLAEAVPGIQFRRLLLAKDWERAMAMARANPLMWLELAERCEQPSIARVARIGMRKQYARGGRIIAVEHDAYLATGKVSKAITKAAEIERDYAASHVGPERAALSFALAGRTGEAVAKGALAVARDAGCPRSAWTNSLALALDGRWPDAVAEARRHATIRGFGTPVTYADLVLEADSGGALLEQLIEWHDVPSPERSRTRVYEVLRAHARELAAL